MSAIQPVENELNALIKRELYRQILAEISTSYEEMQTYINNLAQDIASIDEFVEKLDRDEQQGFDVGTSKQTLLFQRGTLQIDLTFYNDMKKTYLRKIYEDLWNYTDGIITSAVEIEANPTGRPVSEIKEGKQAGCRTYSDEEDYSMSEIYMLLSTTERNLFELSSDIASFRSLIESATEKQNRGFAIGNLLVNLQSQQTKLTLEFKSFIIRLEQFLKQNAKFAGRCLNRVKLISNEIVTEQEAAQRQREEEENQQPQEQPSSPASPAPPSSPQP